MSDEVTESTHQSELEKLADSTQRSLHDLAYIVSSAASGKFGGAINWDGLKAEVSRSIDAIAEHVNPKVATSDGMAEMMRKVKKGIEDGLLHPNEVGLTGDGKDYNYVVNPPWVSTDPGYPMGGFPMATPKPSSPPTQPEQNQAEPDPEAEKAEALKIRAMIENQPWFVPRSIGETRFMTMGPVAIRIMRVDGPGVTGRYRIEADLKTTVRKQRVVARAQTISFHPYWSSERLILLTALQLVNELAFVLYP